MSFFSSRRRHARYWRDWSSDVCSSDLYEPCSSLPCGLVAFDSDGGDRVALVPDGGLATLADGSRGPRVVVERAIGRAACRERVKISVVPGSLKKTGLKMTRAR